METIEEKLKECLQYRLPNENKIGFTLGFKKGIEFAQRWIPVSEELPENITTVLVMGSGVSPVRSTALFEDGKFHPDFLLKHNQVTMWRPIEFKHQ